MTNYLGLDYGRKNLGIAFADGPLARPLITLRLDSKDYLSKLLRIISDNHVESIVIGIPEGDLDNEIRKFGKMLSDKSSLPVFFHPETLTTHEAIEALHAVRAGKQKLQNDHVYAACLILEDYLANIRYI